jgi:hypothetical protein
MARDKRGKKKAIQNVVHCTTVPIDRFAPNSRDEVRRAFVAKGPTQPTGYKFPQSNDKRSF